MEFAMSESNWSQPILYAVLILALSLLALFAIQILTRRALRAIQSLERVGAARQRQAVTLVQIARWVAYLLIAISGLLMLLSTLGIDITPLLASAGIAGLVISLGAQSVIRDAIGGFLIVVENQFAVGDFIQIGDVSGEVEQITLRTTQLRGLSGDLITVPNGEVRIVANQTRDWSRALVDLGVAYEADLDRALSVLEESVASFAADATSGAFLIDPPQVIGPLALGDSAVTMRVLVKVQPGKQWQVARDLRRFLLAACEREEIDLPYPRQEVWIRSTDKLPTNAVGGG
jgi:small conductance mechanosensitive channel